LSVLKGKVHVSMIIFATQVASYGYLKRCQHLKLSTWAIELRSSRSSRATQFMLSHLRLYL
jgi:hypothetical protein